MREMGLMTSFKVIGEARISPYCDILLLFRRTTPCRSEAVMIWETFSEENVFAKTFGQTEA